MEWQRIYLITMATWLLGSPVLTRAQSTQHHGSCDMATAAEVQLVRRDLESLKTLLGNLSIQLRRLDVIDERIAGIDQKLGALESISDQLNNIADEVHVPDEYKKGYRVHHFVSPLGRHKYDLAGAKARCQEEGMTIATPQQLQVAWQEGMDVCSCGWLSDGTNRYPNQYPRDGCGGTASAVITCGDNLRDVYCFESK